MFSAKSSLLITRVEDLTSLAADFQNDQAFTNKISQIAKEYSKLRYTIQIIVEKEMCSLELSGGGGG